MIKSARPKFVCASAMTTTPQPCNRERIQLRYETKDARKDKAIIFKSYSKSMQSKLEYFVNDILDNPRNLNTVGNPEELKYSGEEMWSRELTKKDRIVYGIEPGTN